MNCLVYKGKKKIAEVKCCRSLGEKMRGLMFDLKSSGAFLPDVNSIHMFFVFRPLRIVWLDENMKALDIIIAKPWRIYSNPYAKHTLELSVSLGKEIKRGDKLILEGFSS